MEQNNIIHLPKSFNF